MTEKVISYLWIHINACVCEYEELFHIKKKSQLQHNKETSVNSTFKMACKLARAISAIWFPRLFFVQGLQCSII